MTEYNPKEFILEFFKDCKIKDEKDILTIEGVPKEFEEFIGKKSPYKFVFSLDLYNKTQDSELITQGSYILIAIKDYLSNKGQTSLLNLDIKIDQAYLNKNKRFKSNKILEIKIEKKEVLFEFYFLSIYEYLNEKGQNINKFLLKDKDFIKLDLSKFKFNKGDKTEVSIINIKKQYELVKKKLEQQTSKDIQKIKKSLNTKLERELKRIKDYYKRQIKEKDEEIDKCEEKIKLLENKVKHTFYDRDIDTLNRMIRESKVRLEILKKKNYKQRLKSEESFHVNDEIEKHVLMIKNSLMNITIYTYPIYNITLLKNKKKIKIKYDPILDKII